VEPPEEARRIKDVVLKFLCAVHNNNVCTIDIDEMKKEVDQITIHGTFRMRSRLGRSRSVTFRMALDKQNRLISYTRERMA